MINKHFTTIRSEGHKAAILFLHGFTGDSEATWSSFSKDLQGDKFFSLWDIFSVGYPTRRLPDVPLWDGDPSIETITQLVATVLNLPPLSHYDAIVIVAHSMGGLVAQKLCVSEKSLSGRISHLIQYGTPSAGLKKAKYLSCYKKTIKDMKADSPFVLQLREDWARCQKEGQLPQFLAVAGANDDFVPRASSLEPFPCDQQKVVYGNHVTMIRPDKVGGGAIELLKAFISGDEKYLSPQLTAALAVERLEFHAAINLYEKHYAELDEEAYVLFALALDSLGKRERAIEVLKEGTSLGTDIMGVLAGRYKRRWHTERRRADAERAFELYVEAYSLAAVKEDHKQCHYHAINAAFMSVCHKKDSIRAKEWAKRAIENAALCPEDRWALATNAEAYLYLGDVCAADGYYQQVLDSDAFSPRELTSIFAQYEYCLDCLGLKCASDVFKKLA